MVDGGDTDIKSGASPPTNQPVDNAVEIEGALVKEAASAGEPAVEKAQGSGGAFVAKAKTVTAPNMPVTSTHPPQILMHWVSDQDLENLAHNRTGRLENFFWAMVGACLSAFIPALEDVGKAYVVSPVEPLGKLGLVKILICVVPGALAALAAAIIYRKQKTAKELLDEIRNRPTFTQ